MFCVYCGKKLDHDATVCGYCGRNTSVKAVAGGPPIDSSFPCPACQTSLPVYAQFCCACGTTVMKFAPPENFVIDPQSLRYYRYKDITTPGTNVQMRWVTWFCPSTGKYEQTSHPIQGAGEVHGRPTLVQKKINALPVEAPQGFTLDPYSGLYYRITPGRDAAAGAQGDWCTWFAPSTGTYHQSFHPSAASPDGIKIKRAALLFALPLMALLLGVVFAFLQSSGLSRTSKPTAQELPEEMQVITLDPADMPRFQPMGDAEGNV